MSSALAAAPLLRGRLSLGKLALFGALLGVSPDLDVIGFRFDVPYASFFGHRGFFHSPFLLLLVALAITLAARLKWPHDKRAALVLGAMSFLALLSHPLLDALTTGGEGVMLRFPFSSEREFFSWRPIPVSPLSVRAFFGPRGVQVMRVEIGFILAALLLGGAGALISAALTRRRRRALK